MLIAGLLTSCNSDDDSLVIENKNNNNSGGYYEIDYENEDRVIKVQLETNQNSYCNNFLLVDTKNNDEIFDLDYCIDTTRENWRFEQQNKVIQLAETIKDLDLEKSELDIINFMLDEVYAELFYEVELNDYDEKLFSVISYLKSGVAANLRMINSNSSKITGTVSPTFLVDKTFFIFQEDFSVNLENLRNNISDLEAEALNTGWSQDDNLVNFIKNSNADYATFDELYSFYISKKDFREHIEEMTGSFHEDDCEESCVIGCGTDWGCCGNYVGCCYYSSAFCLWHDLECINCDKWHCGSACQPDGGDNRPVKLIISKF